ncbi:MAG: ABC transporter substrate-binding protein [Firmicutes bacterium]|nr:ABC transporter substrate-binding protein [Bacillota bacterium]
MKQKRAIVIIACLILLIVFFSYIADQNLRIAGGPGNVPGQLTLHTSEFPKSFNAFVNNSTDASAVFGLVYDTLMELDYDTLEFKPLIAKEIVTSADKKVFTVKLDPRAEWADERPIVADDVLFTYETIMNPANQTSVQRMFYSRFEPPIKVDDHTVVFKTKTVHYNNFIALAEMTILPKHLFEGKDFNQSFNMSLPPGSGPYILDEVKEGRYYVLKRRHNYWADQLPHRQGTYNFERIKYKVIRDDNVAFEAFKKGEFDIFTSISGKRWVTETDSERFQKNWIVKQKIYNYAPKGIYGLAFNMRKPLFQDRRVRQAIFHLLDRKTILEKLEYNQFQPLSSYWPSLYGSEPGNPAVEYDPVKAKQLLEEAGFNRLENGVLTNQQGERLEFTISYANEPYEKHLTLFADSCKQAGVKVNLDRVSWATLIKKMDEYKFDMVMIGWSGALFGEPEQLWHSKHAEEIGGSNLAGYKNPEVDRLIDSMPPIFDANKRNEIIKKIDALIYRDTPYVLFWWRNYTAIFYKNIFEMPKTVLPKYSSGGIIRNWRFDPAKIKQYEEAVKKREPLPEAPVEIYYDQAASDTF